MQIVRVIDLLKDGQKVGISIVSSVKRGCDRRKADVSLLFLVFLVELTLKTSNLHTNVLLYSSLPIFW